MLIVKMKATPSSSSTCVSLVSLSSCVIFLLTTIIGNCGVSDADVLLRQPNDSIVIQRGGHGSSNDHSIPSFSSISGSTASAVNSLEQEQKQKLANIQLTSGKRSSSNKNGATEAPPPSTHANALQEQLYFRLLPLAESSRRQSSRVRSLHKRGVRSADDLRFLEEKAGDDDGGGGVEIGYPFPLSMDDYWALDRDRLLDQLVIRALANPDEWTKLRKTFEKVDGDLKALLTLEKGKNQAISDGSPTNGSLGLGRSSGGASSSGSSTSTGSSTDASSSSTPSGEQQIPHHHGLKWKFTYHRVHDLNAAGQPTSRGIAAVVSLDTVSTSSTTSGMSENNKNETRSNFGSATLKGSTGAASPAFLFAKGDEPGNTGKEMVVVAASSLSSASSHFDGPIQMLIPRGGGTSSTMSKSSTSNNSNNNNNISNSFSRFGNKGKHVDLASDKSSASDDNSSKKSSYTLPEPSALVLPKETLSQGNEPNSHKIQWDPRHEQGGGGADEVLPSALPSSISVEKAQELVVQRQHHYHHEEGKQGENHQQQQHHPARHHHHHRSRDHFFQKNYYQKQDEHTELSRDGKNVHEEKYPPVDFVDGKDDDELFFSDSGNRHHYPHRELSPPHSQESEMQQIHYFVHNNNHNHHRRNDDDHVEKQLREQSHHHRRRAKHSPHRAHSSPTWKRFQVDNAAKDAK